MSSRDNLVPTSPRSFITSKCPNIDWIGADQCAPDRPLIKTSGRGKNLYIFYETNVSISPLRKLLHTPIKINVLTHVEGFIMIDAPQKLLRDDCISINKHKDFTFWETRPCILSSRNVVFCLLYDACT